MSKQCTAVSLRHTSKRQVTAKDRPENSLLEAALDVERATRVAPVITVEKTASLEEIIKERILAEKFDDVAPKVRVARFSCMIHTRIKQSLDEVLSIRRAYQMATLL